MQDQQLVGILFSSNRAVEGYYPYATFVTAKDLFGDNASSVAEATRSEIPLWAQIVSESNNGAISSEVLQARFRIQHDLMFKNNETIVEFIPFSGTGIIGAGFWTSLPFSQGSVHLNTSSAADNPIIDPNFISVGFDVQLLTAAARLAWKHFSTPPLSEWVGDSLGIPAINATDEEWKEYILGSGELPSVLHQF